MPPGARDFPFYDGRPYAPSTVRWLVALAAVAGGVAGLFCAPLWFGRDAALPGAILFTGLSLLGLAVLTKRRLGLMFAWPTRRDVGHGIGFAVLNLVVTLLVGWLVTRLLQTAANPVNQALGALSLAELPAFFGQTAFQLVGEELVTVVPFLAVLTLARRVGLDRRAAVTTAALAAALLFAAMHFSTYQWHIIQTVVIIGTARLVLLGAYLTTKNLWASVIAHIVNDWTLFAAAMLLAGVAGQAT